MTAQPGDSVRRRTPYVPITKRPKLVLPGNARVAVWTIVNVENWSPLGAMPRTVLPPMGQPLWGKRRCMTRRPISIDKPYPIGYV